MTPATTAAFRPEQELLRLAPTVPRPTQQALHCEVLEAIAAGGRLAEIADLLCRRLEGMLPRVACSILAVDADSRLRPLAAPSLPGEFAALVNGLAIGPGVGTCGSAAYHNGPVETRDIATDPGWQVHKHIPLAAGLRACWSSPVAGPDGRVVGTFALYFRQRRGPNQREIHVVRRCIHLCNLAMQHEAARVSLEQSNSRLDAALGNVAQGLCFFDHEQRLAVANGLFSELYGIAPGQVRPGMTLRDIVDLRWSAGTAPAMSREEYLSWRDSLQAIREPTDTVVELADGRLMNIRNRPMPGGGWVSTHEDITERRSAEARILHLASHDTLTGLPNRILFRDRLEAVMAVPGQGCTVLCLDLDRFKAVNDSCGHPAGDRILVEAAERLRGCIREGDTVTRLGGDEFAVLLPGPSHPRLAREMAARVSRTLNEPYIIGERGHSVGASVGVAGAPQDGTTPEMLLSHADAALYRAKKEGRGTVRFFDPEMVAVLQAQKRTLTELRAGIESGAFEMDYQPMVDLGTRSVVGFEALLRWRHPAHGLIPPTRFIPLAEETGLIVPLGDMVLKRACAVAARWKRPASLALNISAAQLRSSEIVASVDAALASAKLDPARLELEITETALLDDADRVFGILHRLRDRGVRISLDDFGTGYSSLTHVQAFPFDKIKIDRAFVRDMAERRESLAVVRAIAVLGRSLGVRTTAEGIETSGQLAMAEAEGCSEGQGFLLGRPAPESTLDELCITPLVLQAAATVVSGKLVQGG